MRVFLIVLDSVGIGAAPDAAAYGAAGLYPLARALRRLADSGEGGLFFPQDARVVSTAELAAAIARAHGRRLPLLRGLNPAVRLLGRRGAARRAFGDLAYDPAMCLRPEGYRRFDFEASIRRTEIE